jgi:SpoU rRNA Methylase family
VAHLKLQGRQVIVAHLGADAKSVADVDWTRPTAVLFGNEADGVSPAALRAADACVVIPMAGFAQSLNISVAAAITLHEARRQRLAAFGATPRLSTWEREVLLAVFMLQGQVRSVPTVHSCTAVQCGATVMYRGCEHVAPPPPGAPHRCLSTVFTGNLHRLPSLRAYGSSLVYAEGGRRVLGGQAQARWEPCCQG